MKLLLLLALWVSTLLSIDNLSYAKEHKLYDWQQDGFKKTTFVYEIPSVTNPILFEHVLTTTIEKLKSATKHKVSAADKENCLNMKMMGFDYDQCIDNCAVKSTTSAAVDRSTFEGATKVSSVVMVDYKTKKEVHCYYGFLPSSKLAEGWVFFTSYKEGYEKGCANVEKQIQGLAKLHLDNEFEVYTKL
jgi:hypothetical protein